jgi:hypothetical protein
MAGLLQALPCDTIYENSVARTFVPLTICRKHVEKRLYGSGIS